MAHAGRTSSEKSRLPRYMPDMDAVAAHVRGEDLEQRNVADRIDEATDRR